MQRPEPTTDRDSSRDDASAILARIAGDETEFERRGTAARGRRDTVRALGQLSGALTSSARRAGAATVTSGRWLSDIVVDAAPRIPVRDLQTLRMQHPGLDDEALADALVAGAARATAAVGVAGGALTGLKWSVPVTLVTVPIQLAVETAAVAVIEIKLVAELHEVYGVRIEGAPSQRGAAYALSWANRRGINPLEPATLTAALGVVARRRVQRRLIARAGRGIGTVAPLMAGAVYGAWSNRRQTLVLADALRGDLRRRPFVASMTGRAVSKLLEPAVRRRLRSSRRRVRPFGP